MAVSSKRHAGREFALKMLYQMDIGGAQIEEVLTEFEPDEEVGECPPESVVFARSLVEGAVRYLKDIDRLLAAHAEDWAFERLASVDRNVLRLAVYEMLIENQTPEEIVINEAVELVKAYSTEDSGKFVNGILGNLSRQRHAGILQFELHEPDPDGMVKRKRQPLRMGPNG
jgi:N utilization substance protein B